MWLWFTGDNYCDDENNNEECEWDGGDCCGYDVSTWFCWACECLDPEEQEGDGGGCGSPQWKGDNYCDDDNNNAECEWDGGDCCGDGISILLCSACECLDPDFNDTLLPSGCIIPSWAGDNSCDDINNNEECNWDGGDCCGFNVNTNYCNYCECLDPSFNDLLPITIIPYIGCLFPSWAGDNYCDDENNYEGCDFDGGDCCGDNVNTSYCYDCECLDPAAPPASQGLWFLWWWLLWEQCEYILLLSLCLFGILKNNYDVLAAYLLFHPKKT